MIENRLRGSVVRITFRNEENGYTVAKVQCPDFGNNEITVIGNFPSIDVGEMGEFYGEWVQDPQYGRQFSASRIDFIVPTTPRGIENLLSKGKFRGIGKKYARRIVQKFGKKTIDVLENEPDLLYEVPGIGKKKVEDIIKSWNKKKSLKNIYIFLSENNIPLTYAEKIFAHYKENSIHILRNNPYQLTYDIRGIGFHKADKIALETGMAHDSPERIKAALIYLLRQASDDGHTYLPKDELIQKGSEYLKLDYELIEAGIAHLNNENRAVIDNNKIYLRFLYSVEQHIVKRIFEIQDKSLLFNDKSDISKEILEVETSSNITYTGKQKEALLEALKQKIVVITGGPGTGKTTIIRALIRLFQKREFKVRLAAPTGRAAKRMEETCNFPAQTIHRMLDFNPQNGKFNRNLANPLDTDVVIIDEISMVDTPLMSALMNSVDNNVRVVLVGDADQLPSVGPGNVLKDILNSGIVQVIKLDTVFRQVVTSDIIVAAHQINSGIVPEIDNAKNKNLFFIYEKDPARIPDKIVDLIKRRLPEKYGFDPMRDVQVLTSMYKGDTGANNLNILLQKTLNPGGKSIQRGDRIFLEGDKVMQVRNNYTKDVYNGDIGFVSSIDMENGKLDILFDKRKIPYFFDELDEIVHAYAITVHKSQGSEYNAVVMPLTTQHYIMLQRNLLYTAITRARELMIIIGTYKAFNIAVKNNKTAERYTYLADRLRHPENIETQLSLPVSKTDSLSGWY